MEALRNIIKANNEEYSNGLDSPNDWLPVVALLYRTYEENYLRDKNIDNNTENLD
jgi:hypothetical protein